MSIEQNYSIRFIGSLALREKQIQQNDQPNTAVHKWFARRTETLFRGLLLLEFGNAPIEDIYYRPNSLEGVAICHAAVAAPEQITRLRESTPRSRRTGTAAET